MALSFDLRRAVREVLSHDTGAPGGQRELLTYLMDLLYYGDFRIVEQAASFSDDDHTNLVGMRRGGEGGLLLCTAIARHGFEDPSPWTATEEDPYNPTERDGMLYGLGAVGGRLDLVCKVLAASNVERESLTRPVTIAGLFGPDARVGGAMYLLDSGICAPEYALVGEPTGLELVRAHRGYLLLQLDIEVAESEWTPPPAARAFRLEMFGERAASCVQSTGSNALERALRIITCFRRRGHRFTVHDLRCRTTIDELPERCRFTLVTEEQGWLPTARQMSVERLEAIPEPEKLGPPVDAALESWGRLRVEMHELFRWSAPESAQDFLPRTPLYALVGAERSAARTLRLWLDYRTLPGERSEQLVRDIEMLARRYSDRRHRFLVSVERSLLPMDGDGDSPLIGHARSALQEIGITPVVSTHNRCTEGWILSAARVDTLLFGPGLVSAGNRPNEHNLTQHLERATAFYERIIRKLCC